MVFNFIYLILFMIFFPTITIIKRITRIPITVVILQVTVLSILVHGGLALDGHNYNWYYQCCGNGQPCYYNHFCH